jgi:hypothetical protein
MAPVIILLRIIHILSAIVWLGGMFTMAAFVLPTARRLGPAGGRFLQSLAGESGLSLVLTLSGLLTVVAGLFLYPFASGGFDRDWMRSANGMALGVGAVFGVFALLHGVLGQRPTADRFAALSREVEAGGGVPTSDQLARLTALRDKLAHGGIVGVSLASVAAIAMSIARYL